ncbi:MAG: S-layer homology domain-containing protein, partial [Vulcanococcus sp.]
MHPTKPLWLAPAVLALLSPLAGAAELHPGSSASTGISQYLSGKEQLTTIEQFSDVRPTDWAYQALISLTERYGCVAGYPNGTYRGSRSMTRFEAAALLN